MGNTKRKIVTIVIGLVGMAAAGEVVSGPAPEVTHVADMHWTPDPVEGLPDGLPEDIGELVEELVPDTIPPESGDDMHW